MADPPTPPAHEHQHSHTHTHSHNATDEYQPTAGEVSEERKDHEHHH